MKVLVDLDEELSDLAHPAVDLDEELFDLAHPAVDLDEELFDLAYPAVDLDEELFDWDQTTIDPDGAVNSDGKYVMSGKPSIAESQPGRGLSRFMATLNVKG